ncbi:MAG: nuclear transport factor 2 family protein [Candidatus Binatia bacterium]
MYAELAKGNLWKYLAPLADDVRLTIIGTTRFSGTFTGKATYEQLLRDLTPLFDGRVILTPVNVIAEGDSVVVELRGKSTTATGKPYNNTYCLVFRFANGKVQEIMEYLDTELVTATFGK